MLQRGKNRSVVILGDSMLKDIEQHKVRNGLARKYCGPNSKIVLQRDKDRLSGLLQVEGYEGKFKPLTLSVRIREHLETLNGRLSY